MIAMGCVLSAQAQTKTGEEQFVVYKWYQNGRAHYGKVPPRGVTNFVKLNEYGMVINERPDTESFQVLRPRRDDAAGGAQITPVTADNPANPAAQPSPETAAQQQPIPEGTITREERCQTAQNDLNVMNTKKSIYEEDSNGNLIPLDAAAVEARKAQAQQDITSFCN